MLYQARGIRSSGKVNFVCRPIDASSSLEPLDVQRRADARGTRRFRASTSRAAGLRGRARSWRPTCRGGCAPGRCDRHASRRAADRAARRAGRRRGLSSARRATVRWAETARFGSGRPGCSRAMTRRRSPARSMTWPAPSAIASQATPSPRCTRPPPPPIPTAKGVRVTAASSQTLARSAEAALATLPMKTSVTCQVAGSSQRTSGKAARYGSRSPPSDARISSGTRRAMNRRQGRSAAGSAGVEVGRSGLAVRRLPAGRPRAGPGDRRGRR